MQTQNLPPSLFVVGAPKCGTTSLFDWLRRHPRIHMPRKEPGFFSQDIFNITHVPTHLRSMEEYLEVIGVPPGSGLVGGEATPKYLYSDRALEEIRRLSPHPRIIVCVRDPVDLAMSLHSQKVREGWERESDFAKAWARELNAETPEAARFRPAEMNYIYWAHLGARLERVFSLFGTGEVLVLHLREFRSSPSTVYSRVLRFLDLPDDGQELLRASNRRTGLRSPRLNRWLLQAKRLADPALRPLRQMRGGRGLGILKLVNRYNSVEGAYVSTVSAQLRKEMYDFLAADIALAEKYLGEPLTEKVAHH